MLQIKTEISIEASLERVWDKLINFKSYNQWNPFIQDIQGKLQLGERLAVTISPPGKKKMVFKPKIISLIKQQEFEWLGSLMITGVFDGLHKFELKRLHDNKVQFIHYEIFSGILSKPIFKLIKHSTQLGFEQMNIALKESCEK